MSAPPPLPADRNLRAILRTLGISADEAAIAPLGGGWSGSTIFRISRTDSPIPDLVLRILPGDPSGPQREAAIHRVVRHHDIPVPEIVGIAPASEGTAMVMPLMPGRPLATILPQAKAVDAAIWGEACGAMLARIHAISPEALAGVDVPSWLTWMTPSPAVLHILEPWAAEPAGANDRLLHLDFHPANLLVDADTLAISAVLDWTNARLGPPIADLARTRSILRLFATTGLPAAAQAALAAFETGFQAGWERHFGPVDPATVRAFDAWALDVQIADLAPKLTMPGSWVSEALLDDLRDARDAAMAASLADRK